MVRVEDADGNGTIGFFLLVSVVPTWESLGASIPDPGGADKELQYNDAGALAGAPTLIFDKATGRFGIGTSTPEAPLQIDIGSSSSGEETGIILNHKGASTDDNISIKFRVGSLSAANAARITAIHPTLANAELAFSTVLNNAVNEVMRLSEDGNVGIGTSSPLSPLEIQVGITSSGVEDTLTLRHDGASVGDNVALKFAPGDISVANAARIIGIADVGAFDAAMSFSTVAGNNVNEVFRINPDQDMGIGLIAPTARLHIFDNNSPQVKIQSTTVPSFLELVKTDDVLAKWKVGTGAGTAFSGNGFFIASHDDEIFLEISPTGIVFFPLQTKLGIGISAPTASLHVLNTASQDSFRVDDAVADTTPFIIKDDGKVGINKTDPGEQLDVVGSVRVGTITNSINIEGKLAEPRIRFGTFADADLFMEFGFFNGINKLDIKATDLTILSTANANIFNVDASTGNIGMGVSSAIATKLHVDGNSTGELQVALFRNTSTATGDNAAIVLSPANLVVNSSPKIVAIKESGSLDAGLSFSTVNGGTVGEIMRLTSDKEVGIGTSDPKAPLHIKAGTNGEGPKTLLGLEHGGSSLTDAPRIKFAPGGLILSDAAEISGVGTAGFSADLVFSTSDNKAIEEVMRLTRQRQMGIGIAVPTAKLHVKQDAVEDSLLVESNTNGPFIIKDDGKVGIGISNPQTTLTVAGDLSLKSIQLAGGGAQSIPLNVVFVYVETSAATPVALSIPTSHKTPDRVLVIIDVTGNAANKNITLSTVGSEKINGQDTQVIDADGGAIRIIFNGTDWTIW